MIILYSSNDDLTSPYNSFFLSILKTAIVIPPLNFGIKTDAFKIIKASVLYGH